MKHGEEASRVWATRDRTIAPPQRTLARTMRTKPTDAERKLWWHLRHRLRAPDSHFRRQVQIGRYIADFVCHASKLVVEVDGGQHGQRTSADAMRTRFFESEGYRVLRFWNNDVLTNTDGVLEAISLALTTSTPTPNPSPPSGRSRPSSTGYGGGEKHRRECS
jgi:adenine-specific DNA-methyltransferase